MAALITLPQAKEILRLQDTDHDELVKSLIEGTTSVIEHEVGAVAERSIEMTLREGGDAVALPEANVISLTSGHYLASGAEIDVTGMEVDEIGSLRRLDGGRLPDQPWRLTAQVGMSPVPEAIRRAATEVLKEAYSIMQGPDNEAHKRPFLISYRTAVWLEPFCTDPGFA